MSDQALAERVAQRFLEAVIRKEKGEYCVRSPNNSDWNGGCYDSKSEAEDRLKQVEFFKRQAYARRRMEAFGAALDAAIKAALVEARITLG